MPAYSQLDIRGHNGQPVPNTFVSQDNGSDLLSILLPGFGYTCDMPLFYYAEQILLDLDGDVLNVEYAYNRDPTFQASTPASAPPTHTSTARSYSSSVDSKTSSQSPAPTTASTSPTTPKPPPRH